MTKYSWIAGVLLAAATFPACDDEAPGTTCETKTASGKIAGDAKSVTCSLDGETMALTTNISSCSAADTCKLSVGAKSPLITFSVSGRVCTTPNEITSSGCGDPPVITCIGSRPAPGTYDLSTEASVARTLEITADGTCTVK